jgi:hypothetical protein
MLIKMSTTPCAHARQVEKLFESPGYRNFREQPGKQAVLAQYTSSAGENAMRPHSPNTAARLAERPGTGGAANLTLLENHYKKCERCGQSLGCTCKKRPGSRHGRTRSGSDSQQQIADEVGHKMSKGGGQSLGGGSRADDSESEHHDGDASERAVTASTWDDTDDDRDEFTEASALPEDVLYLMKAKFEYVGGGEGQLTLAQDEVVQVIAEANEDGWAYGRIAASQVVGYFPVIYCVVFQPPALEQTASSTASVKSSPSNGNLTSAKLKAHSEACSPQQGHEQLASSRSAGHAGAGAGSVVMGGKVVQGLDKAELIKQAEVPRPLHARKEY